MDTNMSKLAPIRLSPQYWILAKSQRARWVAAKSNVNSHSTILILPLFAFSLYRGFSWNIHLNWIADIGTVRTWKYHLLLFRSIDLWLAVIPRAYASLLLTFENGFPMINGFYWKLDKTWNTWVTFSGAVRRENHELLRFTRMNGVLFQFSSAFLFDTFVCVRSLFAYTAACYTVHFTFIAYSRYLWYITYYTTVYWHTLYIVNTHWMRVEKHFKNNHL